MKRGYRKIIMAIIALLWATMMTFVVRIIFDDDYASILGVVLGFGSSIILYLFAANYGVHREELNTNRSEQIDEP